MKELSESKNYDLSVRMVNKKDKKKGVSFTAIQMMVIMQIWGLRKSFCKFR